MSNEIMQENTPFVECSAFHRGMSVLEASLRNTEDSEAIISGLLKGAAEFYGASRASVVEADWDLGIGVITYEWCKDGVPAQRDMLQCLPMEKFPRWRKALRANKAVVISDLQRLEKVYPDEAAFFREYGVTTLLAAPFSKRVRTLLTRVEGKGKISFREINGRINELLKQSIKSEGVINLFSDIKEEFSLFDPKFLEEVARMKERNFAVELLRRLIAEQVQLYQRTNTVRAEKFSEILSDAMSRYLKGMLTNEEVIEELLKIAREIVFGEKAGESLNLNSEELAFYDALTKPEAVKDFYSNDQLIAITRELTDALRRNKTIDWNMKESARAGMRRIVKRLLKKYDYPPAGQEDALNTIMEQCKKWNENN